jgi:putative tryptophan/tyrosine transport system substrate-binding protein
MRRRTVRRQMIVAAVLLGLGLTVMPASVDAQQDGPTRRIGIIAGSSSPATWRQAGIYQNFFKGLRELGYEEGRNIAIEFRSAEGHPERFPDIAADLVGLKVDVLISTVCGQMLDAARQATSTIPIVVAVCNEDMVETGIVASLARPGGNVTGLTKLTPELAAKRLELLKEMLPEASRVAVLWDPGYSAFSADWRELRATAQAKGVTLQPVEVHGLADLEQAFAAMVRERADAVITFSDSMTYVFPTPVAGLALRSRLPLISPYREIAQAGGLMAYGPSLPDMFRHVAGHVGKILKGAKPGDLPIEQATTFELVINLKAAKALGLTVPDSLLSRADEVIE